MSDGSVSTTGRGIEVPVMIAEAIAVVTVVVTVVATAMMSSHVQQSWVAHREAAARSTRTRLLAQQLLNHLGDAETGQRGYLLTGDLRYLEPYETGLRATPEALMQLGESVDSPTQHNRVERVEKLANEKLAELKETIDLYKPLDPVQVASKVDAFVRLARASQQLETALREREAALELNERLISVLVDDLRGPLSAISGGCDRLAQSADSEQRRTVDAMASSSRQMDRMIAKVLEYVRALKPARRRGGGMQ